jgi:hypothetical protein
MLDLWRGLALADMVLVHLAWNRVLPEPFGALVRDHTRFAAGGLVLLSGLTAALIFGPKLAAGGASRRGATRALLRRSIELVLLDRAIAFSVGLLVTFRIALFQDRDAPPDLLGVLLFQKPGVTGGLLLLYAFLLAGTPFLLAVSRRFGAPVLAVASAALYALAWATGELLYWPAWTFPLAHWQPIFVTGLLAAPAYLRLRAGAPRGRVVWAIASVALFAGVWIVRFGDALGLVALPEALHLDFVKVPLQPAELLWYLAATQAALATSWAAVEAWPRLQWFGAWIWLYGRNGLLVYGLHLFTEVPIATWTGRMQAPVWQCLLLVAIDFAVLAAAARLSERGTLARESRRVVGRLRESLRAPVAAAAAIALCCLGLGATRVVTLSRFGPPLPVAIADEGIAPVHDGARSAD